jgi:hypothetical protein
VGILLPRSPGRGSAEVVQFIIQRYQGRLLIRTEEPLLVPAREAPAPMEVTASHPIRLPRNRQSLAAELAHHLEQSVPWARLGIELNQRGVGESTKQVDQISTFDGGTFLAFLVVLAFRNFLTGLTYLTRLTRLTILTFVTAYSLCGFERKPSNENRQTVEQLRLC